VIGDCYKRHRAKEFLSFLRSIDRSTLPELDLPLALDNLLVQRSPEVNRWIFRHLRSYFHRLPADSCSLNQVEQWFHQLPQKRVRGGTFRIGAELWQALYAYIENWNESAGPFQRTAISDEIPQTIARARLSIEESVARRQKAWPVRRNSYSAEVDGDLSYHPVGILCPQRPSRRASDDEVRTLGRRGCG